MYQVPVMSIEEGQETVQKLKGDGGIDKYIQPLVDTISKHAVTLGSCSGYVYGHHLDEFEDNSKTPKILKKIEDVIYHKEPDILKKSRQSMASVGYAIATD